MLIDGFDNFGAWAQPAEASEGNQFLQIQTHIDGGGTGTISQSFATTIGQSYTLTFDSSGIYPNAGTDTQLTYDVGGGAKSSI